MNVISFIKGEIPAMTVPTRAAVVHHRGGPFEFVDVQLDDPRPDELLVRRVACGVCHTDITARDGLFSKRFPTVLGHEGEGIVESVGTEARDKKTKDGQQWRDIG